MFRKFATTSILDVTQGNTPFLRTGHRAVFQFVPREGYLYIRSRAISSRCNDNHDMFPSDEIKSAYRTFVGKPVFVNHSNSDHRTARGVVLDAALHEDRNRDGSPDTWAEVLMEIDAHRFPKLAQAIVNGHIDRTSMGVDVSLSRCSVCHNEATSPLEYCAHIPAKKGQTIHVFDQKTGKVRPQLCYEECLGLAFFENSVLVEPPADPSALFLGKPVLGSGLSHLSTTASRRTQAAAGDDWSVGMDPERRKRAEDIGAHLWEGINQIFDPGSNEESRRGDRNIRATNNLLGVGYHPTSIHHSEEGEPYAETHHPSGWSIRDHGGPYLELHHKATGDEAHDVINVQHYDPETRSQYRIPGYGPGDAQKDLHDFVNDHETGTAAYLEQHDPRIRRWKQRRQGQLVDPMQAYAAQRDRILRLAASLDDDDLHLQVQHDNNTDQRPATLTDPRSLWQHLRDAHAHPELAHLNHSQLQAAHGFIHDEEGDDWPGAWTSGGLHAHAAREPSYAETFLSKNAPSADHIVNRFLNASPAEHDAGMNWYSDAHHIAKSIGHGDVAKAAGLIGVYSAGTPVAPNYHYASRSLHHNIAVGGPTGTPEGVEDDFNGKPTATTTQAGQARRMLDGEHHSQVLNSPKVSNFAHLIEHAGDELGREGPGRVVVDRHAVSAAIGRKVSNKEFDSLRLSTNQTRVDGTNPYGDDMNAHYHHIANAYREATDRLQAMGHKVQPHQVQAVAWTVQKRHNDAQDDQSIEDESPESGRIRGRRTRMKNQSDAWQGHYDDVHNNAHMPENPRLHWGRKTASKHLSYGEIKSPQDVDTLRDENCPICGNDIFDGRECSVCGYLAPPKAFGDPDVEKAKQLDTLKEDLEDQNDSVDPSRKGAPIGDGIDQEQAELEGDDPASPSLACTTCGTEMRPPVPQTTDDNPADDAANVGPTEGDVCPVCNKGQLVSTGDSPDDDEEAEEQEEGGPPNQQGQLPEDEDDEEEDPDDPDEDDEEEEDEDDPRLRKDPDDDEDRASVIGDGKLPASKSSRVLKREVPVRRQLLGRRLDDRLVVAPAGATVQTVSHGVKGQSRTSSSSPLSRRSSAPQSNEQRGGTNMPMGRGLQAFAAQQQLIDSQQRMILTLQTRLDQKDSQVKRLTAAVTSLGSFLGPEAMGQMKIAMLRKHADEQNPAQPVPEPAPEPPTESTVQTKTPEAFADVQAPGMVPGTTSDVAADAVSTAYTPGLDIGSPAFTNLQDVTRPIDGTQGPRPTSEVKTNVDVRAGTPMNPQVAFPIGGPFANQVRTGSVSPVINNGERIFAAQRLARLQIKAGIAQGDDLSLAQVIANNTEMSTEQIQHDIQTLNQITTAAAKRSVEAPRNVVPRPAQARTVPSMQSTGSFNGNRESDTDVEMVFLSGLG